MTVLYEQTRSVRYFQRSQRGDIRLQLFMLHLLGFLDRLLFAGGWNLVLGDDGP